MSSLLTNSSAREPLQVPVCCPAVEVKHSLGFLPLAEFYVGAGQVAAFQFLSLHLLGYSTLGGISRVCSAMPMVYVGVYSLCGAESIPLARPILHVGLDAPGIASAFGFQAQCREAGLYRAALVNNHSSSSAIVLVTGSISISPQTEVPA